MQTDLLSEARRQAEICNACRYCEGYCSVFPALQANRAFSDAVLTQLANLCHNCRGCYYACQYTAPHEFDLNLPKALAEVRRDSWESFAWPGAVSRHLHTNGTLIAVITVVAFALLFLVIQAVGHSSGTDFYAAMPHAIMVAIFAPAFLFPALSLTIGLRRYWRAVEGGPIRLRDLAAAARAAAGMKDLAAGHGEGCNFEDEDRFSNARRYAHQAIMYGFLLCFASTCAGTVLHYGFNLPAPYPLWSLPKLLGLPGGGLMVVGAAVMAVLKLRADRALSDASAWGADMAFILLLGFIALSGLILYALGGAALMSALLALHLGAVLSFFLITPFTKMAHGFYRFAALIRDAQRTGCGPGPHV